MIEARESAPCLGVIPWQDDVGIDDEDGYAVPPWPSKWERADGSDRRLRVAVIAYPHASNLLDVEPLRREPTVQVLRATRPEQVDEADVVVLPGSKSTVADFAWLQNRGVAQSIRRHAERSRPILGICGGYQSRRSSRGLPPTPPPFAAIPILTIPTCATPSRTA